MQNLPNQMAGLSLNNDFASVKAPPTHMHPVPNQQPLGNLPPQAAYPNKPMMPPPVAQQPPLQQQPLPPVQQQQPLPPIQQHQQQLPPQQPNPTLNNRPPMPVNNNPNSFGPISANGAPQAQPFNGSTNQFSPQVRQNLKQNPKLIEHHNKQIIHLILATNTVTTGSD